MLFTESIESFINYLITKDKSKATIRAYSLDLQSFNFFLEKKYNCPLYLDEIKSSDIEDYLFYLKSTRNLKTASRNRNLYILRSFWNYAYKKKLCNWNITLEIEPLKMQQQERTFLTEQEFEELLQEIEQPLVKLVVFTLFYTGMRISECLNLQIEDVDLVDKVIHVKNGKGKKERFIPINDNLHTKLKSYIESERPRVATATFFVTAKTGGLSDVYVNSILREATKKLGWKKKVSAHILRHSFASNLIKKGVNLVHVQKLLGHSNLKVTSIYTHASLEDLSASINML
ncbi:tyrosine-type recombinase/integrase [Bacillota bacterium LX-D]|nr:tyrosine-type recombinase/integrase [Bacillota bacterium LX-D]